MFTRPCFIRKNTPELRKKLEELGYNRYPLWMADWDDDDSRYIYLVADVLYYTYPQEPSKPKRGEHINCGTNEELFLALAALRDDSDYMLWFICIKDLETAFESYYKGDFILCKINKFSKPEDDYFRKATVEELIKHFKDK